MLDQVIEDIYEASVAVELWPQALEKVARLGGGAGASFISGDRWPVCFMGTPDIAALVRDYGAQPHENPRVVHALAQREPRFVSDLDLMSAAEIDAHPFYTEFMRPRGFGWCIGTTIRAPGADTILFAVERAFRDGPPEAETLALFDSLRPHLARATLLTTRLGVERARAQAEALAIVGFPAVVLDAQGRTLAANELFAALVPDVAQDRRDRLRLTDRRADKLLSAGLADARLAGGGVRSFPIMAQGAMPAAAGHLVPVRGAARDIFTGLSILLVTPLVGTRGDGEGPSTGMLEALFDLTPAQARVARGIAQAQSLDEIAKVLKISKETARVQLKAVFAKTGTDRQVELARLLAALPPLS